MLETSAPLPLPAIPGRRRPHAVEEHLPLVWRVARQIARRLPSHIEAAELVGAGTIGLVDALDRYEPALCDRFTAYAEIRIRGAILDQLREMDWMPRSARAKRKRIDSEQHRLQNRLGRAPDTTELAEGLGMTMAAVHRMRHDISCADMQRGVELDEAMVASTDAPVPGSGLEQRELRARLANAIAELPLKHQQILSMYYVDQLKLREIGELFKVTESRICQVHREMIERLRPAILDD